MAGRAGGVRTFPQDIFMCVEAGNPESYSGSGSTWFDVSGNNFHVSLVGTPTFTRNNLGVLGGSFTFNGSSQYGTAAHSSLLNLGTEWSIASWVRILNPTGISPIFSTFEYSGGGLKGYAFEHSSGQAGSYCFGSYQLRTRLGPGSFNNYFKLSNANVISNSTWRHVVTTISSATSTATPQFYVNGASVGGGTWCAGVTSGGVTYATSTASVRIAGLNASGYDTTLGNIEIGGIYLYKRVLTQTEITSMYSLQRDRYLI